MYEAPQGFRSQIEAPPRLSGHTNPRAAARGQAAMMRMKRFDISALTLQTLRTITNPPVVYAKLANIAHGPQQMKNGTATVPRAKEIGNRPNRLLDRSSEKSLDAGAAETAGGGHKAVATLGKIDRTHNS